MLCLKTPILPEKPMVLGVQLHLSSKAKKMYFLAFSYVLRRLFGNWAEPVWEGEDPALAGLCGRPMVHGCWAGRCSGTACGKVPLLRQVPGEWSSATSSQAETLLDFQQHVERSRRAKFSR